MLHRSLKMVWLSMNGLFKLELILSLKRPCVADTREAARAVSYVFVS